MSELPSGTVTFLVADGENAAALGEAAPALMLAALVRLDALFEGAVREHGGASIGPTGADAGRIAVFSSAHDAIGAAVAIQRAVADERWPTPRPVEVRLGLHTGEAELRDDVYDSVAVNRGARLRDVGHGGQILLSGPTAGLVREDPPGGISLRYLGVHSLGHLRRPERVYQVVHPALPANFPPLASRDARVDALPLQPVPLLGREVELQAVRGLLLRAGLVTLTGPGGTGKTRLALQVAADLREHFPDGVNFVSLAPIRDPGLVIPTVGQALGLREGGGRSFHEAVTTHLKEKRQLLVLDNFEQVLPAAPDVASLLAECRSLTVLVTSRALLHLGSERELAVPPLALPDPSRVSSTEGLGQYAAIRLFVQRARDARASFRLTDENAKTVANICRRLDGLPLAIELAAAQTRWLSPRALLDRLDRRLPVLTGGARDLPQRQRTLRDTIAWSYDLLDETEQRLFRQLSVFVGGFVLVAADGVASLVEKSLLRQDDGSDGEPRFQMLETIREFAIERLETSGKAPLVRERHARYYVALAEEAEIGLRGDQQATWLDRLETEHDNLRSILIRGVAQPDGLTDSNPVDLELGLRLAGALLWFWLVRGYVSEGARWLGEMLTADAGVAQPGRSGAARAKVLAGAGHLAQYRTDYDQAVTLLEESVRLFQQAGDDGGVAWSLGMLGEVARNRRDHEQAATLLEASLTLARRIGDRWTMYHVLYRLGELARNRGEYDQAAKLYEESLTIRREFGDKRGIAAGLHSLGFVAREQGRPEQAASFLERSLALHAEVGNKIGIAICLEGLSGIALESGQLARATNLLGAVEALCEVIGAPLLPAERVHYERDRAAARDRLGRAAFTTSWTEGRSMPLEQAIALALALDQPKLP
jgi:predicted ATPase/class 3 adenylate cyclase/Tfp pilus assembly protein PilF